MKNNIIGRFLSFIKENLIVILLVIVAGNIIFYFNNDDPSGNYYSATIKVRTNSTFYDRVHYVLEKNISNSKRSEGVTGNFHSYRNEDYYIYEVNFVSRDSSLLMPEVMNIIDSLQNDTMISNTFTRRLKDTQKLISQNQKALGKIRSNESVGELNSSDEFMKTVLMINEYNFRNNLININKEFQVLPFANSDIQFVEAPVALRYLRINLVFLVIGIFIAIAIREFSVKK